MNRHKPLVLTTLASVLGIAIYLYFKHCNTDTTIIMDCLAIITGVAFFLEYHQNNKLEEAQFVIDLNNQFINEGSISSVEHELEMYFTHPYEREKYGIEILEKYALEKSDHQDFVNYLVHLEGIAALVNDGVLRLTAINDLMSYRYFLPVHNPVVQQFELLPYRDYYQGIFQVFPSWAKKNEGKMPMEETRLDNAISCEPPQWLVAYLEGKNDSTEPINC